jgi:photosystem II stability/assembly factor-like uncharacterized protein
MHAVRIIPALILGLLIAVAAPASAQWSQVPGVPTTDVFSIRTNGDTLVAGVRLDVYISTDAGTSWKHSRPTTVSFVQTAMVRNGRVYAGTGGQGVFVSDNLGDTWTAFNQGLVGGFLNSQLDVSDFEVRGDSLYASTFGAGVYVRSFAPADTWHHFGEEFEPNQGSNVEDLALGGVRLIACGGANGMVFRRDPGAPDWTVSLLKNISLAPGFEARASIWNGAGWIVGTNFGVFHSTGGQEPWTRVQPVLDALGNTAFATHGRLVLAAFDAPNSAEMEFSADDGASWNLMESLPQVFVYRMDTLGNNLYAARIDGLWVRSLANVSVPPVNRLAFSLAGSNPVTDAARLRFELAEAGPVSIDVFDVRGRRVGDRVQGSFEPGPHEVSWNTRQLSPGV